MKTSNNGIDILTDFEGLRLRAYPDSGGVWTIGYGTTKINGIKVKENDKCTIEQAKLYFKSDLVWFENKISRDLKVPVKQCQFDALVSLYYNTGGSRTIIALINANTDTDEIIQWWTTHYVTAGGKFLQGLQMRREKEAKLFSE